MAPKLDLFPKLPLGGIDRKSIVQRLAQEGPAVAKADLAAARKALSPVGIDLPKGGCVLLLGGSGGILRALAIQLLFAERVPVVAVHFDSEKLQIGVHHARAIGEAAHAEELFCRYVNADATVPKTIEDVVSMIKKNFRYVHLVNGIASGATKRFAEHGPTQVRDLDVAFDPVRQVPDFAHWSSLRKVGLVEVEVATPSDIERTYRFMGHSTTPWTDALGAAGLLLEGVSQVSFADYEYESDDPVYAHGPLHKAKLLQRESLAAVAEKHRVRTTRLCYPAMNTTALGAIPGGELMFAGTSQILLEQSTYRNIPTLARETVPFFAPSFTAADARLDLDYQSVLEEFHRRKVLLAPENVRENFDRVFENPAL